MKSFPNFKLSHPKFPSTKATSAHHAQHLTTHLPPCFRRCHPSFVSCFSLFVLARTLAVGSNYSLLFTQLTSPARRPICLYPSIECLSMETTPS
ncbi:hypothetical protein Csa_011012 [Cucumis sativus]|nr:hypothetical protein Csa_011012 [Cucumis sativus]